MAALIADTRVQRHQYRSAFYFYDEALKQLPGTHGIHAALARSVPENGSPGLGGGGRRERDRPRRGGLRRCTAASASSWRAMICRRPRCPAPASTSAEAFYWRAKAANELSLQALVRLGQLPPSMEFHQLRAEIARDQNQHLESAKEWRAALELAPGNPRLQHELAVSYFLAADYRTALAETGKVLRLDPRSPEMNFTAGR